MVWIMETPLFISYHRTASKYLWHSKYQTYGAFCLWPPITAVMFVRKEDRNGNSNYVLKMWINIYCFGTWHLYYIQHIYMQDFIMIIMRTNTSFYMKIRMAIRYYTSHPPMFCYYTTHENQVVSLVSRYFLITKFIPQKIWPEVV